MSRKIEVLNKKLKELFMKEFGLTPEEFIQKRNKVYTLKKDLNAEMKVTPTHHYTVEKDVVIVKGCTVKVSDESKDYKFQPLGYSNNFYIEIVNPQILNFGDLYVVLEDFIKAVKD